MTVGARPPEPERERGVTIVEFALLAPLLFMLLFGTLTGGVAISERLSLSHAGREAARYGSTLPDNQFGVGLGAQWAGAVANVARDRASGNLNVSGTTICVALVSGTPGTVVTPVSPGTPYFYSSAGGAAAPCFNDGGTDGQKRVQVLISRPASIEAVLFTQHITLTASADGRFEY